MWQGVHGCKVGFELADVFFVERPSASPSGWPPHYSGADISPKTDLLIFKVRVCVVLCWVVCVCLFVY